MDITEKNWNELKSMVLEIRGNVSKLVDEASKELLTPNEICKILKISRNTFQNYINRNVFEYSKVEGKVYVKRSEIERLIDEGKI
ncbi:helix-turn-helix domain-containing protein [Parabacteroides gordonii]|jgi:hypothetical protein|uniref:helix-turn-helix domain-containing protein n=1 Tax=Parabacteroides gordonii TaxID=574930 RepID=UPI000EBEB874|nr:helix-turn-helix domain-containing protein [Parabacteroides gordonii]RGP17265.1 DNA-binding protein [Parabacteroides gordonii]